MSCFRAFSRAILPEKFASCFAFAKLARLPDEHRVPRPGRMNVRERRAFPDTRHLALSREAIDRQPATSASGTRTDRDNSGTE